MDPRLPIRSIDYTVIYARQMSAMREFYGTKKLAFDWDSIVASVVQKTRHYESTDALLRDVADARVYGGMRYRNSVEAGAQLGRKTAQWVMRNHFERK